MQGDGIGHVDFMLFVSISFALVNQSELTFLWNMGFTGRDSTSTYGKQSLHMSIIIRYTRGTQSLYTSFYIGRILPGNMFTLVHNAGSQETNNTKLT